jgi:hypothetical protein
MREHGGQRRHRLSHRNGRAQRGALDIRREADKLLMNQQLRRDTLRKCVLATQNVY